MSDGSPHQLQAHNWHGNCTASVTYIKLAQLFRYQLPTDKLNEKRTDKLKIKAINLMCYSIKYFHKNVTYHSHMFITTTFNSWCIIKVKLTLNIYTKIHISTQCCSHTWGFHGVLFVFNGSNFFSLKHKLTVQTQTIYCYYFRRHKETKL